MAEYFHVEKLFLDQCHKILKVKKESGSPAPKFESDDDRTYMLIRLPVHPRAMGQAIEERAQSGAQSGAQSEQVITALLTAPLSMNELVTALGLKSKTGSLKRIVSELLASGFIEYAIPDKPSSRLQKYRLTNEGRKRAGNAGNLA